MLRLRVFWPPRLAPYHPVVGAANNTTMVMWGELRQGNGTFRSRRVLATAVDDWSGKPFCVSS